MNDWYGFGAIDAMVSGDEIRTRGWQYCGRRACRDQYVLGYRYGRRLQREAAA